MEVNYQTVKNICLSLKEMCRFFTAVLIFLLNIGQRKSPKRNLVINLDYSFKIEANPVKPTVNQTFPMWVPMAQCVPEYVRDVLDAD